MQKKKVIRTIAIIVFVLLGAFIAFVLMPSLYEKEEATTNIIMLKQNVSEGTRIEENMLISTPVGAYGLDSSVIKDASEIIGLYAAQDISSKDLLFKEKFVDSPNGVGSGNVTADIELADDQMLLTLELSSTAAGAAGNILPGDKVNVAVYRTEQSSSSGGFGTVVGSGDTEINSFDSVIFPDALQEMTVYRVLTTQLTSIDPTSEVTGGTNNQRIPVYITLVCTQGQADMLVEYSYADTLHFIEVE